MTTKKTTKKSVKPTLIIDATECVTADDVVFAFAKAKMKKYLTKSEIGSVFDAAYDLIFDAMIDQVSCIANSIMAHHNTIHFDGEKIVMLNLTKYDIQDDERFECYSDGKTAISKIKKPNVFKRFWNWITRKK